jgi:predicted lipoprotein with Yx(FWY)xxD motif
MRDSTSNAAVRSPVPLILLAAALTISAVVVLALFARGSSAAPTSNQAVVSTAKNAKLGTTILVTRKGLSLYDLSVERKGRFICTTKACLALWHPLTVAKGTTPTGVHLLGTIKRPGGQRQVTYNGAPLYTFAQDHKRGDVNGNGFKDVGTWQAATLSGAAAGSGTSSSGYGYGGY